jgi:hypothetical protein
MHVPMKARRAFRYDGIRREAGAEFTARSKRDADVLEAAKLATRTEPRKDEKARRRGRPLKVEKVVEPATDPVIEEPASPVDLTEVDPFAGRFYGRRDMEAGDE